ncbi:MAG TPA: hypothetical protein PLJ98_00540 [Acholeplasmataceae bacterium]|nr:hypothetical protein [Acholeplasmataceae bacterium]HRX44599.1 hypothetical protein [Acholeplasmataceae bacterium]
MKSLTLYFKRNLYFMISLVTVFLTVVFAVVLLFVLDLGKSVSQTSVGFVYLGSYERNEYEDVLAPRITQWQNTADYELSYQEYTWEIDLNYFAFDALQTAVEVREDVNNPAFFTLSQANEDLLYQSLTSDLTVDLIQAFDFNALLSDLTFDMKLLKNRKLYELKDYLEPSLSTTVIDTLSLDQIDPLIVNEITEAFQEPLVIPANERFYLIEATNDLDLSNEALSVIASALQYLTVKTPVEGYMFERYQDLPLWASPGVNVRILKLSNYDFSFFNPLQEALEMSLEQTAADTLVFTLTGLPLLTTYEKDEVVGPTIYYQTTFVDNPLLDALTPSVVVTDTDTETTYELEVLAGTNGYITYYVRRVTPLGGTTYEIELYTEQTLPINRIVEQNIVVKE